MRRSKILLMALAVVTGLLIGFGSPKEVKAATEKDISGEWKASDLLKIEGMTGEDVVWKLYDDLTLTLDENITICRIEGAALDSLTINGNGKLTLIKTDEEHAQAIIRVGNLTINNGANISVSCSGSTDCGLFADSIIIKGGNVNVVGATRNGIEADNIEITGGEVNATGEYGICVLRGSLTISENASVKATGTLSGILSEDKAAVTITDAKVTATGALGIQISNAPLKISGEKTVVTASGGNEYGAIRIFEWEGGLSDNSIITIDSPLEIIEPKGGAISTDKRYIAEQRGGKLPQRK